MSSGRKLYIFPVKETTNDILFSTTVLFPLFVNGPRINPKMRPFIFFPTRALAIRSDTDWTINGHNSL